MKKKLLFTLFPALMIASSAPALAESITTEGGKINFTGSVVAAPCVIDPTSDGQVVVLGQVPTHRLAAKGDASTAVPFTIKLSGCDLGGSSNNDDPSTSISYTSAAITFNGATTNDSNTLAIVSGASGAGDATAVAKNVGIQILQNDMPVNVDGSLPTSAQKISNGANEIPFSAAYVATADGVVAGTANSTVSFKVTYE